MTDQTRWGIDLVQVRNKAIKYQKDLVASAMAHVVKMDESGITDLMIQIEAEYERKYGKKKSKGVVFRMILNNYANSSPSEKGQKCELRVRQRSAFLVKKGTIVSKLCPNMTFATFLPQKCEPYPLFCEPILRQCEGSRSPPSGRIS